MLKVVAFIHMMKVYRFVSLIKQLFSLIHSLCYRGVIVGQNSSFVPF